MGKSRSSDLVNIMVGDMTCDCWCTTQSSLLRENPWGNGRRYGVVIVRVGVCYCTKKRTRLHHFRKEIQNSFISVDRVGNFGDFNVLGFVLFSSLLLLRCVARFLRWILCFQTFVLMMYLLTVLGDGRRNDEKIGIVSEVGFMGEFIKCWTL